MNRPLHVREITANEFTAEYIQVPLKSHLGPDEKIRYFDERENRCIAFLEAAAVIFKLDLNRFQILDIKNESLIPHTPVEDARSYVLRENKRSSRAFVLEHVLKADETSIYRIYSNSSQGIKFFSWYDSRDPKTQYNLFSEKDLDDIFRRVKNLPLQG
jgi:hypothetical protein